MTLVEHIDKLGATALEIKAERDRYKEALEVIAADDKYTWIHARPSPRKIAKEALRCE